MKQFTSPRPATSWAPLLPWFADRYRDDSPTSAGWVFLDFHNAAGRVWPFESFGTWRRDPSDQTC